MISIIILVHNAYHYVKHTLETLKNTMGVKYEVIVLDNDSEYHTKSKLVKLHEKKYIDKLVMLNENTLFAKGNNIASKLCHPDSKYILLLNSDVEIRNENWLSELLKVHKKGATTLGICEGKPHTRGDGYCFLIDKELYQHYLLDENFEWWWSITKLQALLLNDGYNVTVVKEHSNLLYHYGGKSGNDWKNAKGMEIEQEQVSKWFQRGNIKIIESLDTKDKI